jgi:hypothetical protein
MNGGGDQLGFRFQVPSFRFQVLSTDLKHKRERLTVRKGACPRCNF